MQDGITKNNSWKDRDSKWETWRICCTINKRTCTWTVKYHDNDNENENVLNGTKSLNPPNVSSLGRVERGEWKW